MCTDRNVTIDPTITIACTLVFGTLSGHGTNININNGSNDTFSEATVDNIEIIFNVSNNVGHGLSLIGNSLVYNDKNVTTPLNVFIYCSTRESCQGSNFEFEDWSNITLYCNEENNCKELIFKGRDPANWTIINHLYIDCDGLFSCQDLDFSMEQLIILNCNIECRGVQSCKSLQLRTSQFNVTCFGNQSCQSLQIVGITTSSDEYLDDLVGRHSALNGNLSCSGVDSCDDGVLSEFETNAIVYVNCDGNKSCSGMSIEFLETNSMNELSKWTFKNQSVEVNCNGFNSCEDLEIFCPLNIPSAGLFFTML